MVDGTIYEGGFSNDKYEGIGKILMRQTGKSKDGSLIYKIFEGIFNEGRTPNEGKIYYSDGSHGLYFGDHIEFEKQGYGLLF